MLSGFTLKTTTTTTLFLSMAGSITVETQVFCYIQLSTLGNGVDNFTWLGLLPSDSFHRTGNGALHVLSALSSLCTNFSPFFYHVSLGIRLCFIYF